MPPLDKVCLHIGVEKTGTKTLQLALATNRARLQRDGFLYPRAPGEYAHVGLALYAADPASAPDLRKAFGLSDGGHDAAFRGALARQLAAEISESKCHTAIFSSEHCSSRLAAVEEIAALRELVAPLCRDCRIIIYLRRQDDLAVSQYSTLVQSGSTDPFRFPDELASFDYLRLLDNWSAVFGKQNLDIRVFEPGQMIGGNLIADFFSTAGYANWTALLQPKPQNRSLDIRALEFLRRFNTRLPPFSETGINPSRGAIEAALSEFSTGERLRPPAEAAAEFLARFAVSNREVARRYLGREDGTLFEERPAAGLEPQLPSLDVEAAVDLAMDLWRWQQARLDQKLPRPN
jgi:hypothetical protein